MPIAACFAGCFRDDASLRARYRFAITPLPYADDIHFRHAAADADADFYLPPFRQRRHVRQLDISVSSVFSTHMIFRYSLPLFFAFHISSAMTYFAAPT